MSVRLADQRNAAVSAVVLHELQKPETTYNLVVEADHNYFVGASHLLVHNGGPNIMQPVSDALGPHTTFKVDPITGKVTNYQTWRWQTNPFDRNPWESVKRVDLQGGPDYNKALGDYVDTPHVHEPTAPGGVRPATPDEIPGGVPGC